MDEDNNAHRSRAVLIAGLDDGRRAAQLLLDNPHCSLVGLFVLEDRFASKQSGFRRFDDLVEPPVLRKIRRIRRHVEEIKDLRPDVVFVVGFSQIIPPGLLAVPPLGVVGFHSAVLPGRRGCSPIIWALVDGLTESGVTMMYLDEGIDTGDIIATKSFPIETHEQAADVLEKANQATVELLQENLDAILNGIAERARQDDSMCSYTRKRGAADGEIDWSRPAQEIVNLVRALTPPYPLAHTFGGDGVPILIEKAHVAVDADLPPSRFRRCQTERVLCVVAHPDDEVLGVGGTLARHAASGDEVIVLILSEGEDEKLEETPHCVARRQSALDAAEVMGTHEVIFEDFPDQRLETVPFIEIIKSIEAAILRLRPTVLYTHHGGDANSDHHVVFSGTYAACRPMSSIGASVQRLLAFETPSSTDQAPQIGKYVFTPSSFVDVGPVWEKKIEALRCYPTEMIGGIHPRSYEYIEALARMRGGYAGVRLAEGFVVLRERLLS